MASFSDRLEDWKPPSNDDLEISLPPRREPRREPPVEGERDLGQHGGGAEASPNDDHNDVVAEPEPQRDQPDEGEHTDSTQEQVAARAARQQAVAEESPDEEVAASEPEAAEEEASPEPDRVTLPAPVQREPVDVKKVLSETVGTEPRVFKRVAFSAGDGDEIRLTRFPAAAIDRVRLLLAPSLGGEFAENMSATALVTAFLVAYAGVELELDENTTVAADALRRSDAHVAAVEDRMEQAMDRILEVAAIAKRIDERTAQTATVVDAVDFGVSFLVTDRVAGVSTADMNETNVDVTSRKVITARNTIRIKTKEQRMIEKQRDGRSMA